MNKNVYSIVLTDNVIRAVDDEAYRRGTNRSNLINQILAEYLSCVTPEMRMRQIFDSAEALLRREMLLMQQNTPSVLMLKTALQYKYRPTVNYKIELERNPELYIGRLKVQIRTQNELLKTYFERFFTEVACIEENVLRDYGFNGYKSGVSKDCFTRLLVNNPSLGEEEKGAVIGEYLNMLDETVKEFFACDMELDHALAKYQDRFIIFTDKHKI